MMTETAHPRLSFFQRYGMAAYTILAWALGGGIIYLVVQGILPSGIALASAISPAIAGIVISAVEDGKAGVKSLLGRLLIWRAEIGYWLFAFFYIIPVFLIGSIANPIFNSDPLDIRNMQPPFNIVLMFIAFFIVTGLGEEIGWTGYLIPRLQARYSALTSCIIKSVLWWIWHLPLFYYSQFDPASLADFPYSGWIAQKGLLVALVVFVLMFVIPWSILYTWLFNNTKGSLLLVAILHGSEIWVAYLMLGNGINPRNINNYLGYGTVMVVIAMIVVIISGSQNLSRKHTRIVHQPLPRPSMARE